MQELERKLGYRFRSGALLAEALRHSSYANEHRGAESVSNERLEFLGDSVLGFVTAEYLFARHPDSPEGELTRIRAALVCEESLHEVAQKLELGRYLKLGNGEEAGGGRTRPSILADATEAVIAAVYLDGGLAAASSLIHRVLLDCEREEVVEERRRDYKTRTARSSTAWRRSPAPTTTRPSPLRSCSTARSSGAARGTAKRKPSRWPPARRWSGWNKKTTVGLARRFSFT